MKTSELQKKSRKELHKMLADSQKALQKERFSFSGSKVRNTKSIRDVKKEIARIMTVLAGKNE